MRLIISFFLCVFLGVPLKNTDYTTGEIKRGIGTESPTTIPCLEHGKNEEGPSCTFNGAGSAVSQEIWLDNKEIRSGKDTVECYAGF